MTEPEINAAADAAPVQPGESAGTPSSAGPAEPSLTSRVVKGAAWVFAGNVASRGLGMVKLVVLARLLDPADFGLFGIVMLAIATLETFTQTGFNAALIQKQGNTEEYLDTVWTIGVIRGLVLAAILYFAAPLVGWFFEEPRAVPLLRVMCISVALGGFVNIGMIYFKKDLQFHKQVAYQFLTEAVSLAVGVVLALQLRSVWALVWAVLAGRVVGVALSYVLHARRPRLRCDPEQAKDLFRFGKWMLGSSVVIFLVTQGDDAFVGKVMGTATLGVYQLAYRLSNAPATQVARVISSVSYPSYSAMQDDIGRLRNAFLRVLSATMLVSVLVAGLTAGLAEPFVNLILGAQWREAILPIRLLAVFGLLRAWGASSGPVLYATSNPKRETIAASVQFVAMAVAIYPFWRCCGLSGICIAVILPLVFGQIYVLFNIASLLRVPVCTLARIACAWFACFLSVFACSALLAACFPNSVLALLLIAIAVSAGYVVAASAITRHVNNSMTCGVRELFPMIQTALVPWK